MGIFDLVKHSEYDEAGFRLIAETYTTTCRKVHNDDNDMPACIRFVVRLSVDYPSAGLCNVHIARLMRWTSGREPWFPYCTSLERSHSLNTVPQLIA